MAKQIIILERQDGTPIVVNVAYWLVVPAGWQSYYAKPGAVSVWKGASAPENAAIAAGQVLEVLAQETMAEGGTIPSMQAELVTRFNSAQARLTASVLLFRYGSFCDAGVWTMVTP